MCRVYCYVFSTPTVVSIHAGMKSVLFHLHHLQEAGGDTLGLNLSGKDEALCHVVAVSHSH